MLKRPSDNIQDCYDRAALCRHYADAADDGEARVFWETQELRWLRIATHFAFSDRLSTYLDAQSAARAPVAPPVDGIQALVEVFHRTCATLNLDTADLAKPRAVAQTIIEAALDGEDDLDRLHERAIKAVSH